VVPAAAHHGGELGAALHALGLVEVGLERMPHAQPHLLEAVISVTLARSTELSFRTGDVPRRKAPHRHQAVHTSGLLEGEALVHALDRVLHLTRETHELDLFNVAEGVLGSGDRRQERIHSNGVLRHADGPGLGGHERTEQERCGKNGLAELHGNPLGGMEDERNAKVVVLKRTTAFFSKKNRSRQWYQGS
jgi:hypothetical protein